MGEKTQAMLNRLGLVTVGDVAHTPLRTLQRAVGDHLGSHLHELAWGTDRRTVAAGRGFFGQGEGDPDKSMGADETFGRDTDDRSVILRELLRLTAKVTGRMRVAGVAGRTVTIKVRFADFTTITRSRTIPEATDVTQEIYRTATGLYDALGLQRARIRLVGVRVEGLVPRRDGPPAAGPGGARARLVRRRPGRRPGHPAVRLGRRPPRQPAHLTVRPGTARDRLVMHPGTKFSDPGYRDAHALPRLGTHPVRG